jgi:diadenylate cyclase
LDFFPIGFLEFGIKDFIETLIIASILFYLYKWIRGSFAIPAFIGLVFIFVLNAGVSALGLNTINFFLRKIMDVGILAVFIIFQPEIRKLLYSLGLNTNFDKLFSKKQSENVINEVINAIKLLSKTKTGALIVFAQGNALNDIVEAATEIDARVKTDLLLAIFNKDAPLHDGAIIIKGNRIMAAGCLLPLSANQNILSVFGTRHRAAVGVSESNNVFVVVVSEETGKISIAQHGRLISGLTIQKLRVEMAENLSKNMASDTEISFSKKELEV